jgi:drug/metabolite transporter (DMT)-like permease
MGEIAALMTSICWSLTSVQFTLAGRRIGSPVVNRIRLMLAVLFLSLMHLLLQGQVWPIDAEPVRWGWLALSGIIGLVGGDSCLFQAFVLIGPRLSMLLMTLVPVLSTLLAWGWLGETLYPIEMGAILLTVIGIAWVVSEKRDSGQAGTPGEERDYALGVLLGLGGALGQALALVTAKQGLGDGFPALSATLMRMLAATAGIWLLTLIQGQVGRTWHALRGREAIIFLIGGTLTGPVFGVWLSLTAVQHAHVGIASALMALSPIILIPLGHWIFDERITPRAIIGTVVALTGAGIIFLT